MRFRTCRVWTELMRTALVLVVRGRSENASSDVYLCYCYIWLFSLCHVCLSLNHTHKHTHAQTSCLSSCHVSGFVFSAYSCCSFSHKVTLMLPRCLSNTHIQINKYRQKMKMSIILQTGCFSPQACLPIRFIMKEHYVPSRSLMWSGTCSSSLTTFRLLLISTKKKPWVAQILSRTDIECTAMSFSAINWSSVAHNGHLLPLGCPRLKNGP